MASLKPIKTKCFATLGHSGLVVFPIDSNDRRKVMIPAPVVTVLTPPDTTCRHSSIITLLTVTRSGPGPIL